MASIIEICNLALGNIRAGSINSLTEASLEAQTCALRYPVVRDLMLKDEAWQFNREIRALSLVSAPIFTWAYTYKYPVDCFQINRLIPEYEEADPQGREVLSRYLDSDVRSSNDLKRQVPYEVFILDGVKVIGANQANLRADMRTNADDPTAYGPTFTMAMSHLLAAELAIPIVGGEVGMKMREQSLQLYSKYVSAAITSNQNDQYHTPVESEFVTVRT